MFQSFARKIESSGVSRKKLNPCFLRGISLVSMNTLALLIIETLDFSYFLVMVHIMRV